MDALHGDKCVHIGNIDALIGDMCVFPGNMCAQTAGIKAVSRERSVSSPGIRLPAARAGELSFKGRFKMRLLIFIKYS
jgi:hypothetical protein